MTTATRMYVRAREGQVSVDGVRYTHEWRRVQLVGADDDANASDGPLLVTHMGWARLRDNPALERTLSPPYQTATMQARPDGAL